MKEDEYGELARDKKKRKRDELEEEIAEMQQDRKMRRRHLPPQRQDRAHYVRGRRPDGGTTESPTRTAHRR